MMVVVDRWGKVAKGVREGGGQRQALGEGVHEARPESGEAFGRLDHQATQPEEAREAHAVSASS